MSTFYLNDLPVVTGEAIKGVRYFTTLRHAGAWKGASQGDFASFNLAQHVNDDPAAVEKNRAFLGRALGAAPLWLEQTHSTVVCDADTYQGATPPKADAAITAQPGKAIAVLTADCLPIVLVTQNPLQVAVVHAGWRGLLHGIIENTVTALVEKGGQQTSVTRAWVGPAISQAAFEVGQEVRQAFCDAQASYASFFKPSHEEVKCWGDLPSIAQDKLQAVGVQVQLSGLCTYQQVDRFFSYRYHHPTGRIATVAMIKD